MNILTRIVLAVAHWLLRACGPGPVGQAAGPVTSVAQGAQRGAKPVPTDLLPTHLKLTRDRYGRFRPKDAPLPEPGTTEALLEDIGVTPKMQKAAAVPLALPDDVHEIESFQRRLREYVAYNLDAWITGGRCSVGMAFAALMNTYAIDRRQILQQLDELRLARAEQATLAARSGLPVRNGVPVRTEVKGNTWIAYPGGVQTSGLRSDRIGVQTSGLRSGDDAMIENAQTGGLHPSTRRETRVPKYDPHFDVAASLPKPLRTSKCENGYNLGFGNDQREAIENYYQKNRARLKGQWGTFGAGCKVYEDYDSKGRPYCVARADASVDRKAQEAEVDEDYNRHDATSPREDWQAVADNHWSEPFQGVVDFEQHAESDRELVPAQSTPMPADQDASALTWCRGAVAVENSDCDGYDSFDMAAIDAELTPIVTEALAKYEARHGGRDAAATETVVTEPTKPGKASSPPLELLGAASGRDPNPETRDPAPRGPPGSELTSSFGEQRKSSTP